MKGILSTPQKQYVIDHLAHHASQVHALSEYFRFDAPEKGSGPSVYFPQSPAAFALSEVISIGEIAVLYPLGKKKDGFYEIRDRQLLFHHDLLKSAFHLLSGYDEYAREEEDAHGRFPYKASIQHELGIMTKPVVNYYFSVILEGLKAFCDVNQIPWNPVPRINTPLLMLSHDIDRLDAYHFWESAYKIKQLLGLAPSGHPFSTRLKTALDGLVHTLNPFSKKNPFWTFEFMKQSEQARGINSTYFFLEKHGAHLNSRYRFHEKRIKSLMKDLNSAGHEIALHGTYQSATDSKEMQSTMDALKKASPEDITGIRQHFLRFRPGLTEHFQLSAGLRYDASLGYAEHEGFRHSYCWPFRIYDHRNDQALDFWEIPLNVMDATLFNYRNLTFPEARKKIEALVQETLKFNGVFSLLWHNNYFDENEIPGITPFYEEILDFVTEKGLRGRTGKEIIAPFTSEKP